MEVSLDCLTDEIVTVIVHSVIPLMKYRYLNLITEQLRNIFCQFTCKYPNLGLFVMQHIQLVWPVTAGTKQPLVMRIIMALLALMDPAVFGPCADHFFLFIADSLESPNSLLAAEILTILAGGTCNKILQSFAPVVIEKLTGPIMRLTNHWNVRVRAQAKSAIAMLQRMDAPLVQSMLSELETPTNHRYNCTDDRFPKWASIIASACNSSDFNQREKLAQAERICVCPVDATTRNLSRCFSWTSYRTAVAEAASARPKSLARQIRPSSSSPKWPVLRQLLRPILPRSASLLAPH
jgi:hypothetical protein